MQMNEIGGVRVLTPDAGMKITNAAREFYAEQVWLGCNDSPDNYFDAAEPEAEAGDDDSN